MFEEIYRGKSVFITGHTGFKGSWMALWLKKLGAEVTGFSLSPPTNPSHWDSISLDIQEYLGDIRDKKRLLSNLQQAQPSILFHFAAQALVGCSYQDPIETWSTNVMGTATVLEACREVESIKAIVIITTDKVYLDRKWEWGYREIDPIGGHDPYSASKAACELLVNSYRNSFFASTDCLLATARAGNVIGGGDWAKNRLIPDLMRAVQLHAPLKVRSPGSIRPWQHVLDCLHGYLLLGQRLLEKNKSCADSWNFGPPSSDCSTVGDILQFLQEQWVEIDWVVDDSQTYHETSTLCLDSAKAIHALGWRPVWSLQKALEKTAKWYASWINEGRVISLDQLEEYMEDAALKGGQGALLQLSN